MPPGNQAGLIGAAHQQIVQTSQRGHGELIACLGEARSEMPRTGWALSHSEAKNESRVTCCDWPRWEICAAIRPGRGSLRVRVNACGKWVSGSLSEVRRLVPPDKLEQH